MKKITLLVIIIGFSCKIKAQSIQLLDTTGGTIILAQPSYTFAVDNDSAADFMFEVKNISGSDINVQVKKYIISNDAGNLMTFCIGSLCYGASTTQSGNVAIASGQTIPPPHATTTFGLSTDFSAFAGTGTAKVMYTVFNAANTNDSVSVTLVYNLASVGIKQVSNNNAQVNLYPNPASNSVSLSYDLKNNTQPATLKIYNTIGTLVKTTALENYTSNTKIDISSLDEGVYFYSVSVGGKTVKTNRLVVSR